MTRAIHRHVVLMLNATTESVHVYENIMAILILAVDRNAFLIQTVPAIKHASVANVSILVQALVAKMLYVK